MNTTILVLIIALGLPAQDHADGLENQLRGIQTAFLANRTAFAFGTMTYQCNTGMAPDLEAAMNGEWTRRVTVQAEYAYDGQNARYAVVRPDLKTFPGDLMPIRCLTDGSLSLMDHLFLDKQGRLSHSCQIDPGTEDFFRSIPTFLDAGNPNRQGDGLGHIADKILTKSAGWTLVGVMGQRLEGRELAHVHIASTGADYEYWVDLEQGAIPIKTVIAGKTGEMTMTTILDRIERIGAKGWFPHRKIIYFSDGGVKEFVVQHADFIVRPKPQTFMLEFEEPIAMMNTAASVRYEPQKAWDLRRLPVPGSPRARAITFVKPPPPPPDMPGELPSRPLWPWFLVIVGLVLLAASIALVSRRRLRAGST